MRSLTFVLLAATLAMGQAQTGGDANSKAGKLSVTGSGVVTVTPDVGKIYVDVVVGKPTVADTQAECAKVAGDVINAAEGEGANVTTQNISIQPNITWGRNGEEIRNGYTCTHSLLIEVEQKEQGSLDSQISAALDAALKAGGNAAQVTSMASDLSDELRRSATDQARTQAVSDAAQTAKVLADAAGVTLGNIVSIVDSNYAPPPPVPLATPEVAGAAADAAMASPTPVQTGTTDVTATVAIDYAIENN